MRELYIGKQYKHFKGGIYTILLFSVDTESMEEQVIYLSEDNKVWNRSKLMFNSKVDKEKYPNVEQEYRFEEL